MQRLLSTAWLVIACSFSAIAHAADSPLPTTATEAPRVALVIANSEYVTPGDRLTGPARDADKIIAVLKRLNFRVTPVRNAKAAEIEKAIDAFANDLKRAGPAGIGLIYYAGHGGADRKHNANYLLPVDVPNVGTADSATSGYAVESIYKRLGFLDERRAIVVVLDACRNVAGGTADPFMVDPPDPERGFLLAHSTGQGHAASDSPAFADAFVRFAGTPGLTLEQVFDAVRLEVGSKSGAQLPKHKSGLVDKVCLVSCAATAPAGGKYSGNPVLLKTARADTERLIARLESQQAAEKCRSGYEIVVQLHGSALAAERAGDVDTAGATWEEAIPRATMISSMLRSAELAEEQNRRAETTQEEYDRKTQERAYNRLDREYKNDTRDIVKRARSANSAENIKRMEQLRDEATQLASEGRLYDAADKLVDAVNIGKTIREENSSSGYTYSREKKVERWKDKHPLVGTPAQVRTMISNSPCH